MRAAGLAYAAAGLPVVVLHGVTTSGACTCPKGSGCESAGKHPRWSGWQKHATANADLLAGTLDALPGPYNLGLRLVGTGLAVIDIDSPAGARTLDATIGDALDQTPAATTRRGRHLYVRTDLTPCALAPGLELKAENVVCPPSRNPDGTARGWLPGRALTDVHPLPLPEALAALRRPPSAPGALPAMRMRPGEDGTPAGLRELRRLATKVRACPRGRRHRTLVWAAATARDIAAQGHLAPAAARRELQAAAERAWAREIAAAGRHGAAQAEIEAVLDWAGLTDKENAA
jgi:hypothetical protein